MNGSASVATILSAGSVLFVVMTAQQANPTITLEREIVILNDGVNEKLLTMLQEFLHRKFELPVRVETNFIDLSAAYETDRKQWNYSVMLAAVKKRVHGVGRCVLLTSKDTFGGPLRWSTGVATINGTSAVVSTCRLNPEFWHGTADADLHERRVRKITLHELGHTFGRSAHCENWDCAVHGSNSIGDIDRTGDDYCGECAELARTALAGVRGER